MAFRCSFQQGRLIIFLENQIRGDFCVLGLIHLRNSNTQLLRSLATNTTNKSTAPSASTAQTQGQTGAQQPKAPATAGGSSSNKTSELSIHKIHW